MARAVEAIGCSLIAQLVKNPPALQEILVRFLGWEDSPGEGKGYPLQYSSLENSVDCTVHGVQKSHTGLSDFPFHISEQWSVRARRSERLGLWRAWNAWLRSFDLIFIWGKPLFNMYFRQWILTALARQVASIWMQENQLESSGRNPHENIWGLRVKYWVWEALVFSKSGAYLWMFLGRRAAWELSCLTSYFSTQNVAQVLFYSHWNWLWAKFMKVASDSQSSGEWNQVLLCDPAGSQSLTPIV